MTEPNEPAPPPGTEYFQLGLKGGTASILADLHSLAADISFARQCAAAYVAWNQAGAPTGPDTDIIKRALWTSCCISYRRVFTSGKGHLDAQRPRLRLNKDWTDALTPEQLQAHNDVLESANQHIAHRVNDLEQVRVMALLNPPPLPQGIAEIGYFMMHMVAPEQAVGERLITVCDVLLSAAEQETSGLGEEVMNHLKQQDFATLYANATTINTPRTD